MRTHLRSVFAKVGVQRQTQLIRVILNSVLTLAEPETMDSRAEWAPHPFHAMQMSQDSASGKIERVVVVGGGQAGGEIALEMRKLGFQGDLLILGEEAPPPYKRPPLTKAYFAGTLSEESLYVMSKAALERSAISFRGGIRVESVDRATRTLRVGSELIPYDKLALATGGRPRRLSVPGADSPRVFYLRTIADVQEIRKRCVQGARVAVIGGGFIGLETAAVAAKFGMRVTVLEAFDRVLARVTAPVVSAFFERAHREAGADVRTGVQVTGIEDAAEHAQLILSDGSTIDADLVVVGIGLVPEVELAQQAGLADRQLGSSFR